METFREQLATYVVDHLGWRSHVADEWPDDAVASSTLSTLAKYVGNLDDDHPTVVALRKLMPWHDEIDVFLAGEEFQAVLRSLTFHHQVPPSAALESLVPAAAHDLRTYVEGTIQVDLNDIDGTIRTVDRAAENPYVLAATLRSISDEVGLGMADIENHARRAVTALREDGASWAVIGELLGLSRQGAAKKYA